MSENVAEFIWLDCPNDDQPTRVRGKKDWWPGKNIAEFVVCEHCGWHLFVWRDKCGVARELRVQETSQP